MIRILQFTGNETIYKYLQDMIAPVKHPAFLDYIIHHSKHFYNARLYRLYIQYSEQR
jgi:hypothetical protein